MSVFQIIIVFIVFCIVWIVTNYVNQIMIGRLQAQQLHERIDAAYAQITRLILKAAAEAATRKRAQP